MKKKLYGLVILAVMAGLMAGCNGVSDDEIETKRIKATVSTEEITEETTEKITEAVTEDVAEYTTEQTTEETTHKMQVASVADPSVDDSKDWNGKTFNSINRKAPTWSDDSALIIEGGYNEAGLYKFYLDGEEYRTVALLIRAKNASKNVYVENRDNIVGFDLLLESENYGLIQLEEDSIAYDAEGVGRISVKFLCPLLEKISDLPEDEDYYVDKYEMICKVGDSCDRETQIYTMQFSHFKAFPQEWVQPLYDDIEIYLYNKDASCAVNARTGEIVDLTVYRRVQDIRLYEGIDTAYPLLKGLDRDDCKLAKTFDFDKTISLYNAEYGNFIINTIYPDDMKKWTLPDTYTLIGTFNLDGYDYAVYDTGDQNSHNKYGNACIIGNNDFGHNVYYITWSGFVYEQKSADDSVRAFLNLVTEK